MSVGVVLCDIVEDNDAVDRVDVARLSHAPFIVHDGIDIELRQGWSHSESLTHSVYGGSRITSASSTTLPLL
jgi:hypothetical protein